jgi:5'(3')-deoxyribonucleotidase
MRTIWLDMDGVFADFEVVANSILGREIGWETNDITSEEWSKLASVPNLYRNLPVMPGSTELMQAVLEFSDEFEIKFLTAIPRVKTMPSARNDKKEWIEENFPGFEVEFGPYSKDKWKHSKFLDVLIDDKPSNVFDWFTRGNGVSILHKGINFDKTIKLLKQAVRITTPMRLGNPY